MAQRKRTAHKPAAGKPRSRKPAARKPALRKAAARKAMLRKAGAHTSARSRRSVRKALPRRPVSSAKRAAPEADSAYRFKPGDRVVTRQDIPRGHCRTPYYLRGRPGVIERLIGHFRNPETLAYGKPGLPKVGLYSVRYELPQLWQRYAGARTDTLIADIFEFWLDAA